ncbi:MAG: T9SS type A sorting domain-containing protein [Flavobacteriales bacterium]|nr:T9SS type A sorting domain-containing protein [Flavobacteriales bacterium]
MKKRFTNTGFRHALGLIVLIPLGVIAQNGRIVLNNDAWLRIDNGAWVVIEEPTNIGISTMGTGGNIRSEGEFNRIRWQIRSTTGAYVIPYTTANGVKMPFTYTAIGGASNEATASICFSTYNYGMIGATNWNNDLYRPSDVTHMNNYWLGAAQPNSDNVVDRFWEVDPGVTGFAYSTLPTIQLGFTYDPGAGTGDVRTGNAITGVSAVGAQRFNSPLGQWGDYLPAGVFAAGAVNSVTGANATPANFFRSWTLSNILEPLPVELLAFRATCVVDRVRLEWSTGSESNSSHFTIQRSGNDQVFEDIGQVAAVGTSSTMTNYAWVDERPLAMGYYRLRMVDLDQSSALGPLAVVSCKDTPQTALVNAWDGGADLNITVLSSVDQVMNLELFDASGRVVVQRNNLNMTEGLNRVELSQGDLAMGIYTIVLRSSEGLFTRRVPLY